MVDLYFCAIHIEPVRSLYCTDLHGLSIVRRIGESLIV
jgi:hypothetical protein